MSNNSLTTSKAKPVILDPALPAAFAHGITVQDFSLTAVGFVNVVVVNSALPPKFVGPDTFIHEDAVAGEGAIVAVAFGGFFVVHARFVLLVMGFMLASVTSLGFDFHTDR